MIGKYKVAHLLGITRDHEEQFRHVEKELTKMGYICFAPAIYDLEVYNQYPDLLDDMCYQKLLVCDICVIVTPEHIGKSTSNRIKQAIELNKPVYVWTNNNLFLYKDNTKVQIYYFKQRVEHCKPVNDIVATYIGYVIVKEFDPENIWHLCNWGNWAKEKPSNLYLNEDMYSCGKGLCLIDPNTGKRWLSLSNGWLVGDEKEISDYVLENRYKGLWLKNNI